MFSVDDEHHIMTVGPLRLRTYEDNMVVELALILSFPVELGHLLERVKHGLHNLLICDIDGLPNLEGIRAHKLVLDTTDIDREVLDELRDTVTLLAGEFGILDGLDLLANVPVEQRLQLAVLLVKGVDKESVTALVCIGNEPLQTSDDSNELPILMSG